MGFRVVTIKELASFGVHVRGKYMGKLGDFKKSFSYDPVTRMHWFWYGAFFGQWESSCRNEVSGVLMALTPGGQIFI